MIAPAAIPPMTPAATAPPLRQRASASPGRAITEPAIVTAATSAMKNFLIA
jgi:hypothetical protein